MSVRTRYLTTTLALLAIGLGFGLSQWHTRLSALPKPPARDARVPARLANPPTAGEVLSRAEVLQLRPEQAARLARWIARGGRTSRAWRRRSGRRRPSSSGSSPTRGEAAARRCRSFSAGAPISRR